MSIALGLGIFSVTQIFKNNTLNNKVTELQSQNQKLKKQASSSSIAAVQTNAEAGSSSDSQPESSESSEDLSGKRVAYLTFDDGPSANTPVLLNILKSYNVKGTFFVMGKDSPQRRAWMKMEVDDGNMIGLHSWTHDYKYIYANEQNFLTDYGEIKDMIVSATGVTPKYMRFPGGTNNTVSIRVHNGVPIMPALVKDVEGMGVTPVDWDAGGMDAVYPVPSKDTIENGVVNECRYLKSAVILLHDSQPHASSVAAVPGIITRLRAMGFTFELLSDDPKPIMTRPAMAYKK